MYQYHDLDAILGACQDIKVVPTLTEQQFAGNKEYISASGLKKYLEDPELALRERVLKTSPGPVHSEKTKSKFRIGRAVHAHGLEGKESLTHRFPVFKGEKKAGPDWKSFCRKYPGAAKADNILKQKEHEEVLLFGEILNKALAAKQEYLQSNGWTLIKYFPEISLFIKFERGLNLKARLDAMSLWRQSSGQISLVVDDVKTTSRSVTNVEGLQYDIENFTYHLQGVVYLYMARKIFQDPQTWGALGISDIPPGTTVGNGVYDLIWVSKTAHMCGIQQGMLLDDPVTAPVAEGWNHWGIAATIAAITQHYHTLQNKGLHLISAAQNAKKKEWLNEVAGMITCEPRHNIKYSHDKYLSIADNAKLQPDMLAFDTSEESMRQAISRAFPKPITGLQVFIQAPEDKKETKAPPKVKKVEKEIAPPAKVIAHASIVENFVDTATEKTAFPTLKEIDTMYKAALKKHPALKNLEGIDWTKNLRGLRADIKDKIQQLTGGGV